MPRVVKEIINMGKGEETKDKCRVLVKRLQRGLQLLTEIQKPLDVAEDRSKYDARIAPIREELRNVVSDLTMGLTGKEAAFADDMQALELKVRELQVSEELLKPQMHLQWLMEDVSYCDPVGVTGPTSMSFDEVTCEECKEVYQTQLEEEEANEPAKP